MNQTHIIEKTSTSQARNKRALEIFTRNGFSVRLHGSDNSPMFIWDNRCLLSCFVNGNNLYFRPSPDSGEISRIINLAGNAFITKYEISELIDRSEHLPVYRIQLARTPMCVVGFNRFNIEEDSIVDRFPVFALHNPVIFVNQSKADSIVRELNNQGYIVEVI